MRSAAHTSTKGSPPRVRGEAVDFQLLPSRHGITPACAGRSCQNPQGRRRSRDHPRVCGEKSMGCATRLPCAGSPPRVRGEEFGGRSPRTDYRITPACAGRSCYHYECRKNARDHPRVCGEKICARPRRPSTSGSPPRVRGEVHMDASAIIQIRITPACAGRSPRCPSTSFKKRDHPRVCGEKAYSAVTASLL